MWGELCARVSSQLPFWLLTWKLITFSLQGLISLKPLQSQISRYQRKPSTLASVCSILIWSPVAPHFWKWTQRSKMYVTWGNTFPRGHTHGLTTDAGCVWKVPGSAPLCLKNLINHLLFVQYFHRCVDFKCNHELNTLSLISGVNIEAGNKVALKLQDAKHKKVTCLGWRSLKVEDLGCLL